MGLNCGDRSRIDHESDSPRPYVVGRGISPTRSNKPFANRWRRLPSFVQCDLVPPSANWRTVSNPPTVAQTYNSHHQKANTYSAQPRLMTRGKYSADAGNTGSTPDVYHRRLDVGLHARRCSIGCASEMRRRHNLPRCSRRCRSIQIAQVLFSNLRMLLHFVRRAATNT